MIILTFLNLTKRSFKKNRTSTFPVTKEIELLQFLLVVIKDKSRRDGLLDCIHLQSGDTVKKNDLIYEIICEEVEELIYEPTLR